MITSTLTFIRLIHIMIKRFYINKVVLYYTIFQHSIFQQICTSSTSNTN